MAMYKGETKIKDIYLGTEPIVKVYAGEEFCGFFTLSAYNLVANSDLLIPKASPNENEPLGFSYSRATDISLTNGIAKFTATANFGRMFRTDVNIGVGETVYYFARVKTSNNNTRFYGGNSFTSVPNTNSFEFISAVKTPLSSTNITLIGVYDNSFSNFTPIEVDYMGAINISDLVSRGILPSGLTDAQYTNILDNYFNS